MRPPARRHTFLYASLTAALIGLFVACDKDPLPTNPTRLSAPAIATVQIVGPGEVASGHAVQFTASIRQVDGTTKSALGMANLRWVSSNTSMLTVSQSGLVTASASAKGGEATITVDLSNQPGVRATREILVQPEGTYRIIGSVREAATPSVPIAGARVEVVSSSNFAITDATGQYRLYGVPPQSTLRVSKAGYDTLDDTLTLTSNITRDFGLASTPKPQPPQPLVLNGPYTIAVDFTSACSMSPALQHRSYDAVLTTFGSLVDVNLTEPRFKLDASGRGNHFTGQISAGGVTFTLAGYSVNYSYYYYYSTVYPELAERLSDNTILVVDGVATTTGTAAGLSGSLDGSFIHWNAQFPSPAQWLEGCSGGVIQFRVTPR